VGEQRFALARYSPNGRLDTSFGGDGKVTTDFTHLHDDAGDVSIQQDEKILVGGQAGYRLNRAANSRFALARYNINGSLDLSFSGDGKLSTNFTRKEDSANRITIQEDEKIVAAGYAGGAAAFAIARYLP
jgi:serralysin